MSENIAESEAAKTALNNDPAPEGLLDPTDAPPSDGGASGDGLDDLHQEQEQPSEERLDYRQAVKDTWFLTIHLRREDKGNNFHVTYKEVSDLVFKRLGVPQEKGMLHSVDTSTFKKIKLELDNMVNYGNLNFRSGRGCGQDLFKLLRGTGRSTSAGHQ